MGQRFENFSYLSVVHCHKEGDFEEYARTYYEALNRPSFHKSIRGRLLATK